MDTQTQSKDLISPELAQRYMFSLTELVGCLSILESRPVIVDGFLSRNKLPAGFFSALVNLDALEPDKTDSAVSVWFKKTPKLMLVTPLDVVVQLLKSGIHVPGVQDSHVHAIRMAGLLDSPTGTQPAEEPQPIKYPKPETVVVDMVAGEPTPSQVQKFEKRKLMKKVVVPEPQQKDALSIADEPKKKTSWFEKRDNPVTDPDVDKRVNRKLGFNYDAPAPQDEPQPSVAEMAEENAVLDREIKADISAQLDAGLKESFSELERKVTDGVYVSPTKPANSVLPADESKFTDDPLLEALMFLDDNFKNGKCYAKQGYTDLDPKQLRQFGQDQFFLPALENLEAVEVVRDGLYNPYGIKKLAAFDEIKPQDVAKFMDQLRAHAYKKSDLESKAGTNKPIDMSDILDIDKLDDQLNRATKASDLLAASLNRTNDALRDMEQLRSNSIAEKPRGVVDWRTPDDDVEVAGQKEETSAEPEYDPTVCINTAHTSHNIILLTKSDVDIAMAVLRVMRRKMPE